MTDVNVNMHTEAAAIANEMAKESGIKKAQAASTARREKETEVKGHLLGAMVESLESCPHGEAGYQYGEKCIARLERDWKIDARTGEKLGEAELAELKASLGRKKPVQH